MSAVAEISRPDTAVVFAAAREDLRLVRTPRYPVLGPAGQKVGEHPGEAVQFRDGIARVTEAGLVTDTGGVIPREDALSWLRGHRLYDNTFEGFREVHQAAPAVSQDELSALMAAAVDVDALQAIIAAEESGWAREALLGPARAQLEKVRAALDEIAEQKAAPKVKRAAS